MSHLSRRSLLTGAASGLALAGMPLARAAELLPKKPKNIIFCVCDGMAIQIPTMLDSYLQRTEGKHSYWMDLAKQGDVHNALMETKSLSSVVTDSSAAASTWGSGRYIWNGQINIYPDGTELTNLADLFKGSGRKVGLVTTATVTHATPSGFAINHLERDKEPAIAEQYIKKAQVDILMGGGARYFAADRRTDKKDVFAEAKAKGYTVCRTRDEMKAAKGKILGIFSDSHIPYTVDYDNDAELQKTVPTLSEMATFALDNLKDSPKGFLLQIEGARVDHGAHGNDLAASFFDQLEFERAVEVAIKFARERGDTLVIITSDHATGGPSLNGAGDEYIDSTAGLLTLSKMKSSYGPMNTELGTTPTVDKVREVVEAKLGIQLKPEEGELIANGFKGQTPMQPFSLLRSRNMLVAATLGNYTKVNWTSGNHTSEHVMLTAYGPGSELIHGFRTNVSLFDLMLEMADIKFKQIPQMSFEDAAKAKAKWEEQQKPPLEAQTEPHWV